MHQKLLIPLKLDKQSTFSIIVADHESETINFVFAIFLI